jgi:hypothetical protein
MPFPLIIAYPLASAFPAPIIRYTMWLIGQENSDLGRRLIPAFAFPE